MKLEVKERPDVGVFVKVCSRFRKLTQELQINQQVPIFLKCQDLSAFVVNNADDMDKVMTMGNKNRYNINAIHIYFRKQF